MVTQSNPPAKAGSPRAGCTGPCPGGSGISPEKETPQPPWAACSRAPSPSMMDEHLRTLHVEKQGANTSWSEYLCKSPLALPCAWNWAAPPGFRVFWGVLGFGFFFFGAVMRAAQLRSDVFSCRSGRFPARLWLVPPRVVPFCLFPVFPYFVASRKARMLMDV